MVPCSLEETLLGTNLFRDDQNWLFTLLHADLNENVLQQSIREVLKALLSALGVLDPRTSLCVTFSCGSMLKTKSMFNHSIKYWRHEKSNNSCNQHGGLQHAEVRLGGNLISASCCPCCWWWPH